MINRSSFFKIFNDPILVEYSTGNEYQKGVTSKEKLSHKAEVGSSHSILTLNEHDLSSTTLYALFLLDDLKKIFLILLHYHHKRDK